MIRLATTGRVVNAGRSPFASGTDMQARFFPPQ